tara:strand:+ start:2837 stop:3175 length:339 start_codon:yes stop_codon:yes gene_type:complete
MSDENFVTARSSIHGDGAFATRAFSSGDSIGIMVSSSTTTSMVRTKLGRFINHSDNPNASMQNVRDDVYEAQALRGIAAKEEITISYWDTPSFVAKPHNIDPQGLLRKSVLL